jgi:hypothetical protein
MAEPVYFTPLIPASDVYALAANYLNAQFKRRALEHKDMVLWMARKIATKIGQQDVKGQFASLIEAGKTKHELAIVVDGIILDNEEGYMMARDYGYTGPNKNLSIRRLVSQEYPTLDVASVFLNDTNYDDKFYFRLTSKTSTYTIGDDEVPVKMIMLNFYPKGVLQRRYMDMAVELYKIQVTPPEPPVEVAEEGKITFTEDPETGEIFFTYPPGLPAPAAEVAAASSASSEWGGECTDSICMCHDDTLKSILGKTVLERMKTAAGYC